MTEDNKPPKPVALSPIYRVVDPDPPEVTHVVNFHRVGTDVLMTLGRIDIQTVADKIEKVKAGKESLEDATFDVEVFDRVAMSPDAFARLFFNAQRIFDAMVQTGHLKVEEMREGEDADTQRQD